MLVGNARVVGEILHGWGQAGRVHSQHAACMAHTGARHAACHTIIWCPATLKHMTLTLPIPLHPIFSAAATPGHYLFAWKAAAAATARAALSRPASWPYVLPTQLEVGDLVPVAGAAAAAGGGGGRPLLARVTAIDRVMEDGVYMPHTLTGGSTG